MRKSMISVEKNQALKNALLRSRLGHSLQVGASIGSTLDTDLD
nr:hypothetical protein [uncultured Albidiferax sp.]